MATTPMTPNQPLAAPPPGQTSNFSQPLDHEHYTMFIVTLPIVFSFSTLCFLARVWSRSRVVRRWGWDDSLAFIGFIINVGITTDFVYEYKTGLVYDDWNVRAAQWYAEDYPIWASIQWVNTILIYFFFASVRASILALYIRLMGGIWPKLRIAALIMIGAVFVFAIGCMIVILQFCSPVLKLFQPTLEGTCSLNYNLLFVQALISVILDVCILVPPIPFIWRLSYPVNRKIGTLLILCLGLAVTTIALARTILVSPPYLDTTYIFYGIFDNSYLAMLEVNFGLAVVCLPALNQLARRWRPFRQSRRASPDIESARTATEPEPDNVSVDGSDTTVQPERPKKEKKKQKKKKRYSMTLTQMIYGMFSNPGSQTSHTPYRFRDRHWPGHPTTQSKTNNNTGKSYNESSCGSYDMTWGEKSRKGSTDSGMTQSSTSWDEKSCRDSIMENGKAGSSTA